MMNDFQHQPVLTRELIELLDPRPGEVFVDATIGLGGHAAVILDKLGPRGKLIGIDQDEKALHIAQRNLERYADQLVLVGGNFRGLIQLVESVAQRRRIDGILFDLGVSSLQLNDPERGFSFNKSDRLDMRMDAAGELTAEWIINHYSAKELARVLREFGEEPKADQIAKRIFEARRRHSITTVAELVGLIGGRPGKIHPATRVFQALRIAVNDELQAIETALPQAVQLLKPGGRLAVICFHSLEDRIVKRYFRTLATGGSVRLLTKKAVQPSWSEVRTNRRARRARLRAVEKL
ncbi:MAG: 16S rRNA (cytosine(1402)-N(4))-methyltransferase RsmH [bacterium]